MAKYAWHFVAKKNGKPVLRDGRDLPEVGKWLHHPKDQPLKICEQGLHASFRVIDALSYLPSGELSACYVEVKGVATKQSHDDKIVARSRKVIAHVDCTKVLASWAKAASDSVAHFKNYAAYATNAAAYATNAAADAAYAAANAANAAAYAAANAYNKAWEEKRQELNDLLESMLLKEMNYAK